MAPSKYRSLNRRLGKAAAITAIKVSVAAEKGATFAARGGQFSGCAVERELQLD
jgi:hypothetical protein